MAEECPVTALLPVFGDVPGIGRGHSVAYAREAFANGISPDMVVDICGTNDPLLDLIGVRRGHRPSMLRHFSTMREKGRVEISALEAELKEELAAIYSSGGSRIRRFCLVSLL